MNELTPIKIALADDHQLLRTALAVLINSFEDCTVIFEAGNGQEIIDAIHVGKVPDLVLMDLNMPVMDGYETTRWLRDNYPEVHVLMLTMYDSEPALIRLLQAGVKGFLKKDIHPLELKTAIQSVMRSGYYSSDSVTRKLINLLRKSGDDNELRKNILNDTEVRFLQMTCSDMTYKEIAQSLHMSPRAVDMLRDNLFTRLDAQSRIGLAMFAIRSGLVVL